MFQVQLRDESVVFRDVQPRRKRNRACYERVVPSNIPGIIFKLSTDDSTEDISVEIPLAIASKIPFLQDGIMSRSDVEESTPKSAQETAANCATIKSHGSLWGLLVILSVMLDTGFDLRSALLVPTDPPLAADALAVRFTIA